MCCSGSLLQEEKRITNFRFGSHDNLIPDILHSPVVTKITSGLLSSPDFPGGDQNYGEYRDEKKSEAKNYSDRRDQIL